MRIYLLVATALSACAAPIAATKASDPAPPKPLTFLERAASEPGAVKTDSGLIYRIIKVANGAQPKESDRVLVHYQGALENGSVFDSSLTRGEPTSFALNRLIPCWTEGVQKMHVGEKAQLICPSRIAYGAQGRPQLIPGGATLVFEIELIAIE